MLRRKLYRDLRDNWMAYLACVAVMIVGIMIFTSVLLLARNLEDAQRRFYETYRFADWFADVTSISRAGLERLEKIAGIARVEGQLVKEVRAFVPGRKDPVYVKLVSMDPSRSDPLNGVQHTSGQALAGLGEEVWVDPKFYEAHRLGLEKTITILTEGRKVALTVRGTGQSPAYIYATPSSQLFFTSPDDFGIAYVPYATMEKIFQEKDNYNQISFSLQPGVSYRDVEERLQPALKKYGLKRLYPREDQYSHMILNQELKQLKSTATSIPLAFLVISASILYIMIKRTVEQQRGQIGILKAFGYGEWSVMGHYLSYGWLLGLIGGTAGGLAGMALAGPLTALYRQVFNLPGIVNRFSPLVLILSIMLSVAFSLLAGYHGCKQVLQLRPAEAMRPMAPAAGRHTWIERIPVFWAMLTIQGKMAIRNIFRNKQRSLFAFTGILFSFGLMAMLWSFYELGDELIGEQYFRVETYDAKMTFVRPLPAAQAVRELAREPGAVRVEPVLEAPATLRHQWRQKDVLITGLPRDSELYHLFDRNGQAVRLPPAGIVVSERLAEDLGVQAGARLEMESVWAVRSPQVVEVAAIIPQQLGIGAYMDLQSLQTVLGQGEIGSGALLAVRSNGMESLKTRYRDFGMVSSLVDKHEMIAQIMEQIDSFSYITWIEVGFSVLISFAIVYSTGMISFSERKRELAFLRVLGLAPKEVEHILAFEQWIIATAGMLAGIPFTVMLKAGVMQGIESDLFQLSIQVSASSYLQAAAGIVLSILLAQLMMLRKIKRLKIVEVLKERD